MNASDLFLTVDDLKPFSQLPKVFFSIYEVLYECLCDDSRLILEKSCTIRGVVGLSV